MTLGTLIHVNHRRMRHHPARFAGQKSGMISVPGSGVTIELKNTPPIPTLLQQTDSLATTSPSEMPPGAMPDTRDGCAGRHWTCFVPGGQA
jgi:hypothetical protein